jgi:DNA-binding transcriptional ArsR family regulator
VCHLVEELEVPQPLVSHHLKVLRDAGLVESSKFRYWTYYRLRTEPVARAGRQVPGSQVHGGGLRHRAARRRGAAPDLRPTTLPRRRRAPATGELDRHRRWARRAHPRVRFGPRRRPGRRLVRRIRARQRDQQRRRAGHGRCRRHHGLRRRLPLFPGKRYEDWELTDPAGQDVDTVRPIRDDIEQRVRGLLDSLRVPTV